MKFEYTPEQMQEWIGWLNKAGYFVADDGRIYSASSSNSPTYFGGFILQQQLEPGNPEQKATYSAPSETEPPIEKRCTCGAHISGSSGHSSWCDLA